MKKTLFTVCVFSFLILTVFLSTARSEEAKEGSLRKEVPGFAENILFPQQGIFFYRIPTMLVTREGTIIAAVNARWNKASDFSHTTLVIRRRTVGGDWEPIRTIGGDEKTSCPIGSCVYDHNVHRIIIFGGKGAFVSNDDGKAFQIEKLKMIPNGKTGKIGHTHGSGPGIVLTRGPHAGRLLVPARYSYGRETPELQSKPKEFAKYLQEKNYNCAIYSDDHGTVWKTSAPVQLGTGEGTLAELSDGRIYYNSRAYFYDSKRRTAFSSQYGETFDNFNIAQDLIEPPNGCNASLLRITPRNGKEFLLYTGPQNSKTRSDLSLMISRDNGAHWKFLYNFTPGNFGAYSALAWSEKEQKVCLLYESNKYNPQINYGEFIFAEFNLEWIERLEKSKTLQK